MSNTDHNAFIRRNLPPLGRELNRCGETFEERMTALESLTAGLFVSLIVYHDRDPEEAYVILSACLRARVDQLLYGTKH